jgi:Protein of unknown function (DUF2490)
MIRNLLLAGMVWFLAITQVIAQQNLHTGWFASFNTFSINKQWSIHLDVQMRSTDELSQLQTILLRPGINYHLNKRQVLTAGYAYIPNRYVSSSDNELLAEHRLWQQFIQMQNLKKVPVQHRFRFEERFVPQPAVDNNDLYSDEFSFTTRFRYFVRSVIPLSKQSGAFEKGMFTALQNEVFLNATHQDVVNGKTFDQNRLYVALGYRLVKQFDIEAGYMWQFVERKEGMGTVNNNIAQIALYWRR